RSSERSNPNDMVTSSVDEAASFVRPATKLAASSTEDRPSMLREVLAGVDAEGGVVRAGADAGGRLAGQAAAQVAHDGTLIDQLLRHLLGDRRLGGAFGQVGVALGVQARLEQLARRAARSQRNLQLTLLRLRQRQLHGEHVAAGADLEGGRR